MGLLLTNITTDTCDYNIPVSEDNIYTVEMSVNNIVRKIKTTALSFSKFITICELKIGYSFSSQIVTSCPHKADFVILENLTIELKIDVNCSKINPSSVVSYESSTTDQFILLKEPQCHHLALLHQVFCIVSINIKFLLVSITASMSTYTPTPCVTNTEVSGDYNNNNPIDDNNNNNYYYYLLGLSAPLLLIKNLTPMPRKSLKCSLASLTYVLQDGNIWRLSSPLSAGITAVVTISVSSIISSLLTLLVVYLCCWKSKGNYSINTTSPVYETPYWFDHFNTALI